MNLNQEFQNLIQALNKANAEYALCGGLALSVHGFTRATEDIDLLTSPDQIGAVMRVAEQRGFRIRGETMTFVRDNQPIVVHRIFKAEQNDLLTLDVIEATGPLDETWNSRKLYSIGKIECWVVSRTGLIEMKRLANRAQDKVDIERLEGNDG